MILTDGTHLVSDESLDELHQFAYWKLGLRGRRRFHGLRKGHPHYDVPPHRRCWALEYGALEVGARELLRRMVRR